MRSDAMRRTGGEFVYQFHFKCGTARVPEPIILLLYDAEIKFLKFRSCAGVAVVSFTFAFFGQRLERNRGRVESVPEINAS